MDEIARWNIDHTDILEVLRGQIHEKRSISWSRAFRIVVGKVIKEVGYWERSREYEALRDLYQFIKKQRITFLGNPTMRETKGIGGHAPLSAYIICGIRASRQERGLTAMMNIITSRLLERYLG